MSKITKWMHGEQSPYSGHFETLSPDGTLIPVHSEGQNCLYHAIAQAMISSPSDLRQEAASLRDSVRNSVSEVSAGIGCAVMLNGFDSECAAVFSAPTKHAQICACSEASEGI